MACMFGMAFIMGNATALATGIARERAGAASAMLGAGQFVVAGVVSPMVGLGANAAITMGAVMSVSATIALAGYLWAARAREVRA